MSSALLLSVMYGTWWSQCVWAYSCLYVSSSGQLFCLLPYNNVKGVSCLLEYRLILVRMTIAIEVDCFC